MWHWLQGILGGIGLCVLWVLWLLYTDPVLRATVLRAIDIYRTMNLQL